MKRIILIGIALIVIAGAAWGIHNWVQMDTLIYMTEEHQSDSRKKIASDEAIRLYASRLITENQAKRIIYRAYR